MIVTKEFGGEVVVSKNGVKAQRLMITRKRSRMDSLVKSPKGIPHAIENSGKDDVLRVMVVKAPHP